MNRKIITVICLLILVLAGLGLSLLNRPEVPDTGGNDPITEPLKLPSNGYLGNDPAKQEHPEAPERTWLKDLVIPAYSGEAYVLLNNGLPFFDIEDLSTEPWELYYDLDELGRCTLAEAVAGQETMPTGKRDSMMDVKPTGWHTDRYPQSLVDGQALYNRCHLIAFGMCGESANPYNLVTGTRYFNTDGINAFENMIIDYIRETGNHVKYRVTPVFTGDNLICDGQVTEAWSIEDEGEGICFCIWSYNVQPGIGIDYKTGDNWLLEGYEAEKIENNGGNKPSSSYYLKEDVTGDYVLNVRSKKIHTPDCEGATTMSEKNKKIYSGSYDELIAQGYEPDKCVAK